MEKSYNHIEDFLTDESFRSWVKNPTPELDRQWTEWIEKHTNQKDLAVQAAAVIRQLRFTEYAVDESAKSRIFNKVMAESAALRRKDVGLNWFYKIAALLLITVGIGSAVVYLYPSNSSFISSNLRTKENTIGEKSKVQLSDGTVVFLNSKSTLSYPAAFDSNERVVVLSGEAYFDVAHDSTRPFRVRMNALDILVLGTAFNAKTNASTSEIALVNGKVRLITENNAKAELSPGQQATYNVDNQLFSYTSFETNVVTGWKDGFLVFKNASFQEVMSKLNDWYGLHIVIDDPFKTPDWSYTATFENESLDNVLQNMSALRKFDYSIKNDTLRVVFE